MVNVYENGIKIAKVQYNDNLDFWDGHNNTCGSVGRHKGLTQLKKSGKYVLIHGTQHQGEEDYGVVLTPEEACQEILRSGNYELFDKFKGLKKCLAEVDTDIDISEDLHLDDCKVPVYDEDYNIIARVTYNSNLDYWDGNNMSCGIIGRHLGLTRLCKSGQFVLIHGTQFEGAKDWGEIISPERAGKWVSCSESPELFIQYPELKQYSDNENLEERFDNYGFNSN